jgi:hypothetical protein
MIATLVVKLKKPRRGVAQLVRPYICSLEVISSSLTNLRATGSLHGRQLQGPWD